MLLLLVFLFLVATFECKTYCQPSNSSCWPTPNEIDAFSNKLDGDLILKNLSNQEYITLINTVQNHWTMSYPSFIVQASSHQDVVDCVTFASLHNIQISIQSTGHSYSGRNSANNSLNINLNKFQRYSFNKNINPPTMTIETGMRWTQIFGLINATLPNYVLVGPGDNSVGPAGYAAYGGHGTLTPRHGLSSDHTIEYFIVDANANIVRIYNTSGHNISIDNLFWAMKGGGASTFGIILNMTYTLIEEHTSKNPHDVYTGLFCVYPVYNKPLTKQEYVGDIIMQKYFEYVQNGLDPHWGGYMMMLYQVELLDYVIMLPQWYFGNSTYARNNAQPLFKLNPYNPNGKFCTLTEYKYFWDYQSSFNPVTNNQNLYIWNIMIPKSNLTKEYADQFMLFYNESAANALKYGFAAGNDATIVGGDNNLDNYPYGSTAVTKGFRTSYYSNSIGVQWDINSSLEVQNLAIQWAQEWEQKFWTFRGDGMYSNEENRACDDCNWKQYFWGQTNYDRLLNIKHQWDPNQVFYCNHCVGSDE